MSLKRLLLAVIMAATFAVPAFATESSDKTDLTAITPIIDANGDDWSMGGYTGTGLGYWVLKDSVKVTGGYAVEMYYKTHVVYWKQSDGNWKYWNGSAVTATTDPRLGSPPCSHSANGTTVTTTSGSICDAAGVTWTLTTGTGLQVTKAGVQQGTADVVLMYYDAVNERIYQENNAQGWWYTAAAGTVSWVATVDPRSAPNCQSTVWCDDFNGTALNVDQHMTTTSRWGYAGPDSSTWDGYNVNNAWMSNPLHTGTTGTSFTNLYKLDGSGDLVLGIDNTPGTCTTACGNLHWISGQLIATQTFTQGHYIEARAKMSSTPGTNFAIWLYDDHSTSGGIYQELDIVEAVRANDNSWTNAAQTIHHDPSANEGFNNFTLDFTQWHTYGVDWEPGAICFYIDRTQTGCATSGVSSYTGTMHLWLSAQSAGATWGGNLQTGVTMPAGMTIDYVRSYDHKPF